MRADSAFYILFDIHTWTGQTELARNGCYPHLALCCVIKWRRSAKNKGQFTNSTLLFLPSVQRLQLSNQPSCKKMLSNTKHCRVSLHHVQYTLNNQDIVSQRTWHKCFCTVRTSRILKKVAPVSRLSLPAWCCGPKRSTLMSHTIYM